MSITAYELMANLMQSDPEYAWVWHCNMAMPIMDTVGCSHKQANEAAAHLMQHLWGVDITTHENYHYGKSGAQEYAEMRIAADLAEDAEIAASRIEARSGETGTGSIEDESLSPQGDAQKEDV